MSRRGRHPARRTDRGERDRGRRRARGDARGALRGQAGGAREQGSVGDGGRPRHPGGAFRTWTPARVADATVDEALRHPTWKMGKKITVDSATLVNKALEVIEAHFLFGLAYDAVDVVVHPQSVVHAFVEFVDGSVLAQLGFPNMELPILYALTHPERVPDAGTRRFDPVAAGSLTFEAVRADLYPAYALGRAAAAAGGTAPAAFNAANEVAVELFLDGKIRFGRIAETIARVLDAHRATEAGSLEAVLAVDAEARRRAVEAACC